MRTHVAQRPHPSPGSTRQFRACARERATARRPTPSGPWKIREAPSRPSARVRLRKAMPRSCPTISLKAIVRSLLQAEAPLDVCDDLLRDLLLGCFRGDDADAGGVLARDLEVPLADPRVEGELLVVEPGRGGGAEGLVAGAGTGETFLGIEVEEQRHVGLDVGGGEGVDDADDVHRDPAAGSLVGRRGVREAIAEDDLPFAEGGLDDLLDVLRPRRAVEEKLGDGDHAALGIEEEGPDLLADDRPARLAGDDVLDSLRREELGEEADLGGLARSFDSLEGDEACGGPGQAGAASARRSDLRFVSLERWAMLSHRWSGPRATGGDPIEHAFDTDVLVDVRPVHALAGPDEAELRALLERGLRESPRPGKWDADNSAVYEVRDDFIFCDLD